MSSVEREARKRQADEDRQVEDAIRDGVNIAANIIGGSPAAAVLRAIEAGVTAAVEAMKPKRMVVEEGGKPTGTVDLG